MSHHGTVSLSLAIAIIANYLVLVVVLVTPSESTATASASSTASSASGLVTTSLIATSLFEAAARITTLFLVPMVAVSVILRGLVILKVSVFLGGDLE